MVVVCEINVDIVVAGLQGPPVFGAEKAVDRVILTAGSSGVLAATGMAALGLRVAVCGLIGDDLFGRVMLDHLDRHGIDRTGVVIDPAQRTGASIMLSAEHDRAILTDPGAMAALTLDRIRLDVLARARHLHFTSYFLQAALRPQVPALLERAHALGLTISADTGHDPEETWCVADLLPGLDLFLPNQVEALAISGGASPAEALEWLAARVPTAVVKLGPDGAMAACSSERVCLPAFAVPVRDTSGAGDAFDAGFLSGWLAGQPLAACVARGNACGALTAAHLGGTGGFDRARVEALLG